MVNLKPWQFVSVGSEKLGSQKVPEPSFHFFRNKSESFDAFTWQPGLYCWCLGLAASAFSLEVTLSPWHCVRRGPSSQASAPSPSGAGTWTVRPADHEQQALRGGETSRPSLPSKLAGCSCPAGWGAGEVLQCRGSALTMLPASGHEALGSRWVSLEVGILIFKHSKMCCS